MRRTRLIAFIISQTPEKKERVMRKGGSLRPIHILRLRADRQLLNASLPLRKRDLFFKLLSQAVWPRAESSRLSRIVTGIILALCPYICKERESLFLCYRRQFTYLRILTQHLQVLQPYQPATHLHPESLLQTLLGPLSWLLLSAEGSNCGPLSLGRAIIIIRRASIII